jgi:hypothetical protein
MRGLYFVSRQAKAALSGLELALAVRCPHLNAAGYVAECKGLIPARSSLKSLQSPKNKGT